LDRPFLILLQQQCAATEFIRRASGPACERVTGAGLVTSVTEEPVSAVVALGQRLAGQEKEVVRG
jgi:hypothetical protein